MIVLHINSNEKILTQLSEVSETILQFLQWSAESLSEASMVFHASIGSND